MDTKAPFALDDLLPFDQADILMCRTALPMKRDGKGNAIPTQEYAHEGLLTFDGPALEHITTMAAESPDAAWRLYAWLKGRNAIKAEEQRSFLGVAIARAARDRALVAKKTIAVEQTDLRGLGERDAAVAGNINSQFASLGLQCDLSGEHIVFGDDESSVISEVAGKEGVAPPREKPVYTRLLEVFMAILCGLVFGCSLGMLLGKVTFIDMAEEWPSFLLFWVVGVLVMGIVGKLFLTLGHLCGDSLYEITRNSRFASTTEAIARVGVAGMLIVGVIAIEASVEKAGLFKGLVESSQLHAISVSPMELQVLSLMLALPAVVVYFLLGYAESRRLALLAYLRFKLRDERKAVRMTAAYQEGVRDFEELKAIRNQIARVKANIERLNPYINGLATIEEINKLKDLEALVNRHSWEAEDALLLMCGQPPKHFPTRSLLSRARA